MDVANNSNQNGKRLLFSPMEALSPTNPTSTTAIDVAKTSTVALAFLPLAISSLAEPLCTEFTKLLHELYSHSQTKEYKPRIQTTFLVWHTSNLNSEPVQGSWGITFNNPG